LYYRSADALCDIGAPIEARRFLCFLADFRGRLRRFIGDLLGRRAMIRYIAEAAALHWSK